MVTVNQNAMEKVSSASLNNNSTKGRVLSVKPKVYIWIKMSQDEVDLQPKRTQTRLERSM